MSLLHYVINMFCQLNWFFMYKTTGQFEYLLSNDGLAYRPCYSKITKRQTQYLVINKI